MRSGPNCVVAPSPPPSPPPSLSPPPSPSPPPPSSPPPPPPQLPETIIATPYELFPSTVPLAGGVAVAISHPRLGAQTLALAIETRMGPIFEAEAQALVWVELVTSASGLFVAPPSNRTGYGEVRVLNGTGDVVLGGIYYDGSGCSDSGTVLYKGQCRSCASFTGAYCPGGPRFWPKRGYWSFNEAEPPSECYHRDACPGSLGEIAGYPPLVLASGARDTQVCADGYQGEFCSSCEADYFVESGVCTACGSSASVRAELAVVAIVACGMFVIVIFGLLFLSAASLVNVVSGVIAVQQLVLVARMGLLQLSSSTSVSWLALVLRVASIINFEVEVIKPGCTVGAISFPVFYGGLVVFVVGIGALFVAVVAVRSWLRPTKAASSVNAQRAFDLAWMPGEDETMDASTPMLSVSAGELTTPSPEVDADNAEARIAVLESTVVSDALGVEAANARGMFAARATHAVIILVAMTYLQVALRTAQVLHCGWSGDGKLRLVVQRSLVCYQGRHAVAAALGWLVGIFVLLGFPIFVIVRGIQAQKQLVSASVAVAVMIHESIGFVIRSLRLRFLWFRALHFVTVLVFVAETVVIHRQDVRIVTIVCNFGVSMALVALLDPFRDRMHTMFSVVSGMASSVVMLVFLYRYNRTLFGLTAVVQVVAMGVVVTALAYHIYLKKWKQARAKRKIETDASPKSSWQTSSGSESGHGCDPRSSLGSSSSSSPDTDTCPHLPPPQSVYVSTSKKAPSPLNGTIAELLELSVSEEDHPEEPKATGRHARPPRPSMRRGGRSEQDLRYGAESGSPSPQGARRRNARVAARTGTASPRDQHISDQNQRASTNSLLSPQGSGEISSSGALTSPRSRTGRVRRSRRSPRARSKISPHRSITRGRDQ
ncbi:uncharacterized protein AMSG_12171 [Thecamonas trahens ATCC 50062]|uniref:TRP C-terminal domain-containing protein n=1 Tax=Thecamonas trahens ATCC 50062 TaxID=461836 RepID=A0A0L0DKR8_THETB|nr:hypothetical protein AMSG_12171 [Thecamonas trahens ATCC 50062]KNC52631.1 hypothetical protein AMSG_12171 [Thecamonas trahens ATCC 50062]|eukprot:XP_013755247.1 hypothetical protein AMSG_12171 [Thecamonas trahens ATCC 50062]